MDRKALIAYASKHGSTREIAERIRSLLKEKGVIFNIASIENVKKISEYSDVILGSALYIGRWDKRMVKFVKKNQEQLHGKRVWFFSSGPTEINELPEDMNAKHMSSSIKKIINFISPVDMACFPGCIDIEKLSIFEKWIVNKVDAPIGDYRDWTCIETWADNISKELNIK